MKFKDACSLEQVMINLDSILKSRDHHFADKGPYSQRYGFFSSHVWMWELNPKEGWASKNWCFQVVVLKKTLESPLDSKIKPVNIKGNQPWLFIETTDAEAETPVLRAPDANSWLIRKDPDAGKDWRLEEKGTTQDELVGWDHQLNEHEFEQTLGVGEGQGRAWRAAVHGVEKSQTWLRDWMTAVRQPNFKA